MDWRKNKAAVNLKTGRFDNINSAVIISSVCKAVQNNINSAVIISSVYKSQFCTALHTLLMMTAEFMLSKRSVLRFTAALFFLLKLFSSHIYCILEWIGFYSYASNWVHKTFFGNYWQIGVQDFFFGEHSSCPACTSVLPTLPA